MNYNEFFNIGSTADQLQAVVSGAYLESNSYATYAAQEIQQAKAVHCLAGLKSQLEAADATGGDNVAGARMLIELEMFHAFLDSIRIAVRPRQPTPSPYKDQSGMLDDLGQVKKTEYR